MICPLYRGRDKTGVGHCVGKDCMFTDKSGQCLVKQALQCYVNSAKEKTEFVRTHISKPYQFLEPGDTSPAKLRHGGVYEDITPSYDNLPF